MCVGSGSYLPSEELLSFYIGCMAIYYVLMLHAAPGTLTCFAEQVHFICPPKERTGRTGIVKLLLALKSWAHQILAAVVKDG